MPNKWKKMSIKRMIIKNNLEKFGWIMQTKVIRNRNEKTVEYTEEDSRVLRVKRMWHKQKNMTKKIIKEKKNCKKKRKKKKKKKKKKRRKKK